MKNEREIPVTARNGYATVREDGFSFTIKAAGYSRVAVTKEGKLPIANRQLNRRYMNYLLTSRKTMDSWRLKIKNVST